QGRMVNFKNTVIIMTSNIASPIIQDMTQNGESSEAIHARVMAELREELRPEFLNRIDETIVFSPLSRAQITKVIDIQLAHLHKLLDARKIKLELTNDARLQMVEEG